MFDPNNNATWRLICPPATNKLAPTKGLATGISYMLCGLANVAPAGVTDAPNGFAQLVADALLDSAAHRMIDPTGLAYNRWHNGWIDWADGNIGFRGGAIILTQPPTSDDDHAMTALISDGKLAGFYAWLALTAPYCEPGIIDGGWLPYVRQWVGAAGLADEARRAEQGARALIAAYQRPSDPIETAKQVAMLVIRALDERRLALAGAEIGTIHC